MKTFMANASNIERKWFVVDADGKTLGRLAAEVAKVFIFYLLRSFCSDFV